MCDWFRQRPLTDCQRTWMPSHSYIRIHITYINVVHIICVGFIYHLQYIGIHVIYVSCVICILTYIGTDICIVIHISASAMSALLHSFLSNGQSKPLEAELFLTAFKEKALFNQHWYWAPVKLPSVLFAVYFYWFSFSLDTPTKYIVCSQLYHMHWWQMLTVKLERERFGHWSDLLREVNDWISWSWEEVFESETVDDMGEDGVVRPPLA